MWDVFELETKTEERCDSPNVTTVYLREGMEPCPCPWAPACSSLLVTGASHCDCDG